MEALSGVIWICKTLPIISGSNNEGNISNREVMGRVGVVVRVSAKVQVHYFICLTWLPDEKIYIKETALFLAVPPNSSISQTEAVKKTSHVL